MTDDFDLIRRLPTHIKDRMLRKLTYSSYVSQKLDLKKILSILVHCNTKYVNFSLLRTDDEILQILKPCSNLQEINLSRCSSDLLTSQGNLYSLAFFSTTYIS